MTTSHILTDEEIEVIDSGMCGEREFAVVFARAIEAALEAKLAALSGHAYSNYSYVKELLYTTADQMREAFAQGAASQLSAEPCWYACKIEGAECDVTFFATKEEADDALYSDLADYPELTFEDLATPLYTRKEPT